MNLLFSQDIFSGFKIMIYGLSGVFGALLLFYISIKLLVRIFPEE